MSDLNLNWHDAEEWCPTCGAKIRVLDGEKHHDWHERHQFPAGQPHPDQMAR